jgi:hypothetical protein
MANRNLRPISLGDIIDEGFDLYKKNFLLLLLTVAVVVVPIQIIGSIITQGLAPQLVWISSAIHQVETNSWHLDQIWGDLLPFLGSCGIVTLFCLVPYSFAILATVRLSSSLYLQEEMGLYGAYSGLFKRIVPVVLTSGLYILLTFVCYISCVVPVLIPLLGFPLVAYTLTLENRGVGGSFKRAWALAKGELGRILGCVILLILLATVITLGCKYPIIYGLDLIIGLVPGGQAGLNDSLSVGSAMRDSVLDQVGTGVAVLLTIPLLVSITTVFYYDLRVRKEAFDIELLAKDLNYPELDIASVAYTPAAFDLPVQPMKKPAAQMPRVNPGQVPYGAQQQQPSIPPSPPQQKPPQNPPTGGTE